MAEVKYSKAIAESIENYLNEKEWKFMPVDENGVIRTGLKLRNKLKSVDIFFRISRDSFTITLRLSIGAGEDIEDLIVETAGKLLDGKTDITPEQMDWIFHSTSCRAAVKAGDYTSPYEMQRFVKKLLSMPDIRYCPHGRPVMIKMTKYEIEKQFGRQG